MYFLFGILAVVAGALLVIKSEWFYENFGSIAWAEEHLGSSGGSRLMYKLVGIVFIFIGFLLITGQFTGFLGATLGRIFFRS
jgi:hypothetical protein